MTVYIYEDLEKITTNYHDGGSLVIVTDRRPGEAWHDYLAGIAAEHSSNHAYLDPETIIQTLPEPTLVVQAEEGGAERVFTFADSGCC